MSESRDIDGWPKLEARMASATEVHAFGQATLIYNYLEEVTGRMLVYYLPTDIEFSEALFHRMGNPDRMLLLTRLIEGQERDSDIIEALKHFIRCYDICTENRNILMHASLEPRTSPDILPLSKRSKDMRVGKIFFQDEMGDVFDYGTRLKLWLTYRSDHDPELAKMMGWPSYPARPPLPDKPQKPRKLSLFQPPKDQPSDTSPPAPSQGMRPGGSKG
jgi:hypothetical protein